MATKTTKRYQLLTDMQLSTYFRVNGEVLNISFTGGFMRPFLTRGRFITDDPAIQEAIESSAGFGKQYYLETQETTGDPDEAPVETTVVTEETPATEAPAVTDAAPSTEAASADAPATEAPAADPPPPEITDYPEVTTLQEAREKLISLFPEFTPAKLVNTQIVIKRAEEKKISFSKLVIKKVTS